MHPIPCSLCGYDAPGTSCTHCALTARERSLVAPPPPGPLEFVEGLRAIPMGALLLLRGRGLKRWLVPPFLLTLLAAAAILYFWVQGWVEAVFGLLEPERLQQLDPGWWRDFLTLLAGSWLVRVLQGLSFLVASILTAWLMFSLFFEAIAGPFLDEVQGRLEERWFGENPRDAIQRPTRLPAARCALWTTLAALPATLAGVLAWRASAGFAALLLAPLAAAAPFVLLGLAHRDYGRWLWWVVRVESELAWVSLKAALFTGLVLVLFLWLHLVPLVGPPAYLVLSGFAVAIGILDIPFSRRDWSLRQRLAFLRQHALAVAGYGVVGAFLMGVPILGPIVMVPAASAGGLWLVVRLDKNGLRPKELPLARARRAKLEERD
jgi:uncharacterized protein involved in cysteine biosynthesis